MTELRQAELDVIGVRTDVSQAESVEALAQETLRQYGKVNLVCNNAGVFLGMKPMWESTLKDWQWIMGVNLWGVIHGVRTFVPIMLESGEEGHVINTASQAGLVTANSIYSITKHAVVALSEGLHIQLQNLGAPIGVSALCPLFVDTKIMASERNRPEDLQNSRHAGGDALRRRHARLNAAVRAGRPGARSGARGALLHLPVHAARRRQRKGALRRDHRAPQPGQPPHALTAIARGRARSR